MQTPTSEGGEIKIGSRNSMTRVPWVAKQEGRRRRIAPILVASLGFRVPCDGFAREQTGSPCEGVNP